MSLRSVKEKYGFCSAGIGEFCAFNGLDTDEKYLSEEIVAVIEKNKDENVARFGKELRQMGLVY